MKLFSWFQKKNAAPVAGIHLAPGEAVALPVKVEIEMFSGSLSKITCTATDCFFNGYSHGDATCDMKQIDIDSTGRCRLFKPRATAAKFFQEDAK